MTAGQGLLITGNSVDGTSSGTGFLITLGLNATGNKQLLFGDPDYAGSSTASFVRIYDAGSLGHAAGIDAVLPDGSARAPLQLGEQAGSGSVIIGNDSTATDAASMLWVNANMSVGAGYKANAAPTNGAIIQGNVGIGTTTPITLLDVEFSSSTVPLIRSYGQTFSGVRLDTSSANANARNWGVVSNYSAYGDFGIVQSNALGGDFTAAGTTRLYINNAGNVGVGTLSPGAPLEVSGVAATPTYSTSNSFNPSGSIFAVQATGGNGLTVGVGTAAYNYATWLQSGFEGNIVAPYNMLLEPFGGNVGIGTAAPQSLLQAYGGEVQVGSSGTSCSSANAGAIRYSGGTLYYCDNLNTWESVDSSGGADTGDYYIATGTATPTSGEGMFGGSATLGAVLAGYGSISDTTLENRTNTPALEVPSPTRRTSICPAMSASGRRIFRAA